MTKAMKGIGVIKILGKLLPRHSLLTIYIYIYIYHLYALNLAMVIYSMINQGIKVFGKKLKLFNTVLLWSLLLPSKVYLKLKFTMN